MFKHILVPTDGSAISRRAVVRAMQLAALAGARVTGLFVAPAPTPLVFEGLLPVRHLQPEEHAALIERASARYLGVVAAAAKKHGVVNCDCVTLTGEYPAEAILQIAAKRRCDLIVMASHGRRGVAGVLLGSETQKVLAHSRVPVLVCR